MSRRNLGLQGIWIWWQIKNKQFERDLKKWKNENEILNEKYRKKKEGKIYFINSKNCFILIFGSELIWFKRFNIENFKLHSEWECFLKALDELEKKMEIQKEKITKVTHERNHARQEIKDVRKRYKTIIGIDDNVDI